ncbi:MAG TPA: Ig-like domain-containing protein, partial [Chitinophagaceae bacterium]
QVSPTIHIGDYTIPVHNDYDISIKADVHLNDSLKEKVVMQMQSGNSVTIANGDWQGDWMQSSFNELGNARLLLDTIAPVITPVGWKNGATFSSQKNLILKCTDDLGSVVSFMAKLDGRWLMFAKKNDYFTYSFDEHCASGVHILTITATDVAGNEAIQTFNFTKQ